MKNNFLIRLITGIVLIIILLPAIYFGGIYFLIVSVLLSIIGSFELMNMFSNKSPTLKSLRIFIPLICGGFVYCLQMAVQFEINYFFLVTDKFEIIQNGNNEMIYFTLAIIIFVLGFLFALMACIMIEGSTAHDFLACATTLLYTGLLLGLAVSVQYLNFSNNYDMINKAHGITFAYLYIVVATTDIFAYVIGSQFGGRFFKRKLCPNISPKKSIEGAIGGLFFGGILGTIGCFILNMVSWSSYYGGQKILLVFIIFVTSCIISITVQFGDLVASKLKRTYDIKDYGFIFPGHGGVMDRFDSLIFSGAFLFIFLQILVLVCGVSS